MVSPVQRECSAGSAEGRKGRSKFFAAALALMLLVSQPWCSLPVFADDTGGSGESGGTGESGAEDGSTGESEEESDGSAESEGEPGEEEASEEESVEEDPEEEVEDDPEDEAEEDPEDEDEGEDEDNADETDDDADSLDDSELVEGQGAFSSGTRRFAVDGLPAAFVNPATSRSREAAAGRNFRRVGTMAGMVDIRQWEDRLLSNWATHRGAPLTQESEELEDTGMEIILPPSKLPKYRAGDTYVYSNGTWERVVATDGISVQWVNHRGNKSSGSVDFTYKRTHWQTSTRRGTRAFQATEYLFSKSTASLWPLQLGNKTRFDEYGQWMGRDGIVSQYDSFWRCEVEDKARVLVPVGEFDSWTIGCSRYSDSFSYPKSPAREYRTYQYAPALSHWIVEDRKYRTNRDDTRKELVAVMPDLLLFTGSDRDVENMQRQFQNSLENHASGQSDIWISGSKKTSSTLTPLASFLREDGVYCRQYLQYLENGEFNSAYAGMACRDSNGMWKVFRR